MLNCIFNCQSLCTRLLTHNRSRGLTFPKQRVQTSMSGFQGGPQPCERGTEPFAANCPLFPSAGPGLTCAQQCRDAGGLGLHHVPRAQGIAHSDTHRHAEAQRHLSSRDREEVSGNRACSNLPLPQQGIWGKWASLHRGIFCLQPTTGRALYSRPASHYLPPADSCFPPLICKTVVWGMLPV